jgi:hypoxanthine phosphoribosyltransferase
MRVIVGGQAFDVLLTAEAIAERLPGVADEVLGFGLSPETVAVIALKGGLVFGADLLRHLPHTYALDYVQARSYGSGAVSSGRVELLRDIATDIAGRDVLLIDDILDTGLTSAFLLDWLSAKGAARVRLVTLLDKPDRREVDLDGFVTGFRIPDHFVVGYGLDRNEQYRGLPFVGVPVEPE